MKDFIYKLSIFLTVVSLVVFLIFVIKDIWNPTEINGKIMCTSAIVSLVFYATSQIIEEV